VPRDSTERCQIPQRISTFTETARCASISPGEVIRSHPAVTRPADQTADNSVLPPLFQHADSVQRARLWDPRSQRRDLGNHGCGKELIDLDASGHNRIRVYHLFDLFAMVDDYKV
jgi:hypothetical protein